MKYLLDANVLMHYANDERKQAKIDKRIRLVGIENIYISTVTLYELHTKLIKAKVSADNVKKLSEIAGVFTVKNFNTAAAIAAAKVRMQLEDIGRPSGHADMMIAGHAKSEKAMLITNNTKDFEYVHGLRMVDWLV